MYTVGTKQSVYFLGSEELLFPRVISVQIKKLIYLSAENQ